MSKKILGIDFGTTNCCFAIYDNKDVKIITNDNSQQITPSVISFYNEEIIIGNIAKEYSSDNFKNTIYGIKRLIGRNFDDPEINKDIKNWPFKVIKDFNTGKPKIEIEYNNKIEIFTPEEIISMILRKIKEFCKNFLGKEIKNTIITVPAYFNDLQRKSMKMAFEMADFNVINILNEPIAAAISYRLNINVSYNRNVLIFDLGGGTFDISIITIKDNKFDIKCTGGDSHLGGDDFDYLLMDYFIKEFKKNSEINIRENKKIMHKLKIKCEECKIRLSYTENTEIILNDLPNGEDYSLKISRNEFEDICKELFDKIVQITKKTINDSPIPVEDILDYVLVGGSSNIPKIENILYDIFKFEPHKTSNNELAVASGAAIYGAFRGKFIDSNYSNIKINNITSLSYGLELDNGEMDIIIPKNSKIPFEKTEKYKTADDNQTKAKIIIYQGENFYTEDNTFIDEYTIPNLIPKPKGEIVFDVTFKINENGILTVKSVESGEGQINKLKFNTNNGLNEEIFKENINRDSVNYKNENIEYYRNDLYKFANDLQQNHESYIIRQKAFDCIKWLNNNENLNKNDIISKKNSLKSSINYFK